MAALDTLTAHGAGVASTWRVHCHVAEQDVRLYKARKTTGSAKDAGLEAGGASCQGRAHRHGTNNGHRHLEMLDL